MADFTTRITILTSKEIEDLYRLPKLTDEERALFFALDPLERNVANSHRSLTSKMFFILQLGYFKAKKLFFTPVRNDIQGDIEFIKNTHFPEQSLPETLEINKITRWNQQKRILQVCHYQECDAQWRMKLQKRALQTVKISSKPIFIFKDLLGFLHKHRVVLPAYSTMQDIVSKATVEERERLSALVMGLVTSDVDRALQKLLKREDSAYLLTMLKKEPKDFKCKQISREIAKQKSLAPIYGFAKKFLPLLGISNDNVKYYASLVDFYSVFRIKRLRSEIGQLYLFCFIYYRYQRINDNLINTFIYYVRKYADVAKLAAKLQVYQLKADGNRDLDKAGKVLSLFLDDEIPDETTFREIRERAFGILEKDKFQTVTRYISNAKFDEKEFQWIELEKLPHTFKKNLRPVLLALDFESTSKNDSLMNAVDFLKTNIHRKKRWQQ